MSKKLQLIQDMADVIFKHGLELRDPVAKEVLERANYEYLPKDNAVYIEEIRQANLHALAG